MACPARSSQRPLPGGGGARSGPGRASAAALAIASIPGCDHPRVIDLSHGSSHEPPRCGGARAPLSGRIPSSTAAQTRTLRWQRHVVAAGNPSAQVSHLLSGKKPSHCAGAQCLAAE